MGLCDICNREGSNAIVPCATFRRAVLVDGLDPFRLGLVPGRSRADAAADFDVWCGLVRANETDWGLCGSCHAAYQGAAAPMRTSTGRGNDLPAASLDPLRRAHPLQAPPNVPADWRPGLKARLFGRARPWGGCDEAVALVQHGRIAEARELLQRLIAHGADTRGQLFFCLECLRPPADATLQLGKVVPGLPAAAKHAVDALVAWSQRDYGWLAEAVLAAATTRPADELSAFAMLAGFVAASDLWLQTQLLHPRRRELTSIIVCRPVKALALLMERRHDEAWQTFHAGVADPASIVTSYEQNLSVEATDEERADLTFASAGYSDIGLGLVLFDLGYEAERRAHFARLVPKGGASHLAEACQRLA